MRRMLPGSRKDRAAPLSPVATQRRAARIAPARRRWSVSLIGATAVMPGFSPEATMIQPTAPCSPPSAPMAKSVSARRRLSAPLAQNQRNGRKNTSPMSRPSCRCAHSHQ